MNQKTRKIQMSLLFSMFAVFALVLSACSPATASTVAPTDTVAAVTDTPAAAVATDTPAAAAATDTPAAAVATDTPAAAAATDTPAAAMTDTPAAGTTPAGTAAPMITTMINVSTSNSTLGKFLVDSNNMTLYTFKNDTPDTSSCIANCLVNWPPLIADKGAAPQAGSGVTGTLGVITRSDGLVQVTYNHMPLYYYKNDTKAGDTNGQGVGSVWYVAAP